MLGYTESTQLEGEDSALDEEEVLRVYDRLFPHETWTRCELAGSVPAARAFSHGIDQRLLTAVARGVIAAHVVGRRSDDPDASGTCAPHLFVELGPMSLVLGDEAEQSLLWKVRHGAHLLPVEKALLTTRQGLETRIAWALAWVNNHCRRHMPNTLRAMLPISFATLREYGHTGGWHANVFACSFRPGETLIEVLEPNGRQAFGAWGLGKALDFEAFVSELRALCGNPVRVRDVGEGLQTALGAWSLENNVARFRGYPVCGAVCLWILSRFSASEDSSLRRTDHSVFKELTRAPETRHGLQREFLEFMRGLSRWRSSEGAEELRQALMRNYRNSNVIEAGLVWRDGYRLKVSLT